MVEPQDLFGKASYAGPESAALPTTDRATTIPAETSVVPAPDDMQWAAVAGWLSRVGADVSPAGLHGTLAGALIADPHASASRLVDLFGPISPLSDSSATAFMDIVGEWRVSVLRSLLDPDLGFAPLFPDADAPLSDRLRAMAEWVDGVLAGLGQSPRLSGVQLDPEAAEILRDFAAIAQVRVDAGEDEQSECEWTELVEYLRVASLCLVDLFSGDTLRAPAPQTRV